MIKFRITLLISATGACLIVASPAQAYLDPGTGSMLLQLALGGIAGLLVIGKLYWARFVGLFRQESTDTADLEQEDEE